MINFCCGAGERQPPDPRGKESNAREETGEGEGQPGY